MKPIVHYIPTLEDRINVGEIAFLWNVLDHPSPGVSNMPGQCVATSFVVRLHDDGFETTNTRYVWHE